MSSGLQYHRLEFRDVEAEQFKEVLDRANLEHTIIGGQHGRAEIEQFHGADISLDKGNYAFPVVARGQFAPENICIGMAQGDCTRTWINGSSTGRGDLQLYYEGADLFYRAGPGGHWAGLTVTRERLQAEARRRLRRELPLSDPGAMEHLHVDPRAFARLTRLIRSLRPNSCGIARFRDANASAELLLGAYAEAIATADSSTVASMIQQRAEYRYYVVRRADVTMRSLIGEPYSSMQLCKRLGMSERNLELYFHESLGVTPKTWFQYLSLHQARTMLRRGGPGRGSVTDVALACGFEHFGRFSEAYRELFGERPSETLRSSTDAG
jgi:AraC-like DNA-binding protein